MKKTVLLHSCCAPCSAAILEWMLANDWEPVLFYYNPNIFPQPEYEVRKNELSAYAARFGLRVIDGDWDHSGWREAVRGLEREPERGARCLACFRYRLLEAARVAHEQGIPVLTTTLASSRWKRLDQVSEAGRWAVSHYPDVEFWDRNWRKGGLQERRGALLRENHFYNQLYCGCEFSMSALQERRARQSEQAREDEAAARSRIAEASGR